MVPTIRTFYLSLTNASFFGPQEFVGFANYSDLPPGLSADFRVAALAGLLPAVAGYLIGHTIGRLLAHANPLGRRIGLGVIGLVLVTMAPASFYFAWIYERGVGSTGFDVLVPALILWLGAAVAVGAVVGHAAGRGRRVGRGGSGVVGVVVALGGLALGIQMTTPALLSGVGMPMIAMYQFGFVYLELGTGAAVSAIALVLLISLGCIATALLLRSRVHLRLSESDRQGGPHLGGMAPAAPPAGVADHSPHGVDRYSLPVRTSPVFGAAGLVLTTLVTLALLAGSWAWLSHLGNNDALPFSRAEVLLRTWGGAGLEALVLVAVATSAAVGIGYLRPFGDRSEQLLWVFAPWLFIGVAPLSLVHYLDRHALTLIDTSLGTLTPQLLAVPLLFVFTYVAAALRRSPGAALRHGVAVLGLAWAAMVWLTVQSMYWPTLMVMSAENQPAVLRAHQWAMQTFYYDVGLSLLTPLPLLFIWAGFFAVSVAGLRRFALIRGDVSDRTGYLPPGYPAATEHRTRSHHHHGQPFSGGPGHAPPR